MIEPDKCNNLLWKEIKWEMIRTPKSLMPRQNYKPKSIRIKHSLIDIKINLRIPFMITNVRRKNFKPWELILKVKSKHLKLKDKISMNF